MDEINERLDRIEQLITNKLDPLLDLLQTVVKTGIKGLKSDVNSDNEIANTPVQVELIYNETPEHIYISGSKTYDNRELIKATFKGSSWNKEKSAWAFKNFEGYEKILTEVFPNIIKGQS